MKAYWVANYTEIKDDERLKKYAVKAKEAVEKYSGKIIARSANNVTLEGREMVRVALAEFPDIETAKIVTIPKSMLKLENIWKIMLLENT